MNVFTYTRVGHQNYQNNKVTGYFIINQTWDTVTQNFDVSYEGARGDRKIQAEIGKKVKNM